MELLSGPLEKGDGETGFHSAGEEDVDDFEEEDELYRTLISSFSLQSAIEEDSHTFSALDTPMTVAADV